MITRIMSATHARVSKRDEATLADLEKENALLVENQSKEVSPTETFDEKLEPLLQFLANPWKLWENGSIELVSM